MNRSPVLLAIGLLVPLLAGCNAPSAPTLDCGPVALVTANGAWAFTSELVEPDGVPAYRIPGTAAHTDAACWLRDALRVEGWDVQVQSFTGADYQALEAGAMAPYLSNSAHCSAEERDRVTDLEFHNVLARHDGPGDKTILLAAHWDSKAEADQDPDPARRSLPVLGANDGAAGVGILLQLQRELADLLPVVDVDIAFFDGEDGFEDCHPVAGSLYHARTMQDAPDAMLLLDMVGDADARFPREGHSDDVLVDLVWGHAAARGLEQFTGSVRSVLDDHVPFVEEGVRSIDIIDYARDGSNGHFGFPWYWHTTEDTLDKLDADFMDEILGVLVDTLTDPELAAILA